MAGLYGIPLIDHVVTNGRSYFSFVENGLMQWGGFEYMPTRPADAEWEVIPTSERERLTGGVETTAAVKAVQTADPDHAHLIYLDTRLGVVAVERVKPGELVKQVIAGAGREGAFGVVVGYPATVNPVVTQSGSPFATAAQKSEVRKLEEAIKVLGIRLIDVAAPDWSGTMRELGMIMEDAGKYEAESFSLARPLAASDDVKGLRKLKTEWSESGFSYQQAEEIISKFYKRAAFAAVPRGAILVPMPSTSGRNSLPVKLADRIAADFGNPIFAGNAGITTARAEAKTKTGFWAKMEDPVQFVAGPDLEKLIGTKLPVVIVEDVHNTGESWVAFADFLFSHGIEVADVAALTATDGRLTSARDIERLAEKLANFTGKSVAELKPLADTFFNGSFKQFFNKAEAIITGQKAAERLVAFIAGSEGKGRAPGETQQRNAQKVQRAQPGARADGGQLSLFGDSFSLGSVNTLEAIAARLEEGRAAGGAAVKLEAYADLSRRLEGMARAARGNEETEAILRAGEIEEQRKRLQQELLDDKMLAIYSGPLGETLTADESAAVRDDPFLQQFLASETDSGGKKKKGGRGIFLSRQKGKGRAGVWCFGDASFTAAGRLH